MYAVRPLRITCGTVIVDGTELRSFFLIGRNRWKNSSLLDFKETLETIFPTENPSTISVYFVFAKNGGRSNSFVLTLNGRGKERHHSSKSWEALKENL